MWTLGVDYGTGSWKTALLEDGATRELASLPTMERALAYIAEQWTARPGLEIVLPSGFGVPLMRLNAANDEHYFAMSLRKGDPAGGGLGLFLKRLQARGVDGYCLPAVKLLPTVPAWRGLNRVDMGTSDKLCAAAYLMALLHEREQLPFDGMSFLSLEVGYAFKCWLVIAGGHIVDAIGGTGGTVGPRSRGAIDGELAYLHGFASKADIYGGGWADLAAMCGEETAARSFWEGLLMERMALSTYYQINTIVVSGRRRADVLARWGGDPDLTIRVLHNDAEGYEAALGAALLADGLAGGRWAGLVRHLQLAAAGGHPLDRIAWGGVRRPER